MSYSVKFPRNFGLFGYKGRKSKDVPSNDLRYCWLVWPWMKKHLFQGISFWRTCVCFYGCYHTVEGKISQTTTWCKNNLQTMGGTTYQLVQDFWTINSITPIIPKNSCFWKRKLWFCFYALWLKTILQQISIRWYLLVSIPTNQPGFYER